MFKRALFVLSVLFATAASGDVRDELNQQKAQLENAQLQKAQLNVNQSQLDSAISLHRELSENLIRVRELHQATAQETDLLSQKLAALERSIDAQNESLSQLTQNLDSQRSHVHLLYAQAWQLNPNLSWRVLLSVTRPNQVARQMAWLRHMLLRQRTAIGQLEMLRNQKTVLVAQSRVDLEEQARVEQALLNRTDELLRLARLEQEKQQQLEDSITALRRSQALLTDNVKGMEGVIRRFNPNGGGGKFQDDSEDLVEGSLPWPFDGKVANLAVKNGKRANGAAPRRGLLIIGEGGTAVRCVHRGRVVFAEHLKGWGATVVVRHGSEFMSVYAYNERLTKAPGDFVEAGETLAVLSDFRALRRVEAPVLYFALYKAGEVLDPQQWLSSAN